MIGGFDTMQEKEVSLCTWLHHIATFTGIYAGLYQLMTKELNCWRKGGLILFTSFQSWAGIKILRDAVTGIPRFRQVCDSIHNLTNDSGQRQRTSGKRDGEIFRNGSLEAAQRAQILKMTGEKKVRMLICCPALQP